MKWIRGERVSIVWCLCQEKSTNHSAAVHQYLHCAQSMRNTQDGRFRALFLPFSQSGQRTTVPQRPSNVRGSLFHLAFYGPRTRKYAITTLNALLFSSGALELVLHLPRSGPYAFQVELELSLQLSFKLAHNCVQRQRTFSLCSSSCLLITS